MSALDDSTDELPADDAVDEQVPAPKSALSHVGRLTVVGDPPHHDVTISGVPHPAHRSA